MIRVLWQGHVWALGIYSLVELHLKADDISTDEDWPFAHHLNPIYIYIYIIVVIVSITKRDDAQS